MSYKKNLIFSIYNNKLMIYKKRIKKIKLIYKNYFKIKETLVYYLSNKQI